MRVKLCKHCGYQLARRARRCAWCQSPIKRHAVFKISILLVFASLVFLAWFLKSNGIFISPPSETTRQTVVKINQEDPSIKKPRKVVNRVYVKAQIANMRKNPFLESQTIRKLKKGQRLTLVSRSGNWVQVLAEDWRSRAGWVHASLVEKIKPLSPKAISEKKAFKTFRKSFDRFNTQIKNSKGMSFFIEVEYLDQGMIQVTATDILLSAPKRYKQNYVRTLMQMWLDARESIQPASIQVVDATGRVRLKEIRTE